MEDHNLQAKRRNLIVSSVLLTIFHLGGGHPADDKTGTLGLMFVSLEYPTVAIVGAWVAWIYFVWRFLSDVRVRSIGGNDSTSFRIDLARRIFTSGEDDQLLYKVDGFERGNNHPPFFYGNGVSFKDGERVLDESKNGRPLPTQGGNQEFAKKLKIKYGLFGIKVQARQPKYQGDGSMSEPFVVPYTKIIARSEEGSRIPPRIFHDAIVRDPGFSETEIPKAVMFMPVGALVFWVLLYCL
ncbi:hypothetical protein [Thiohalospira halophila]|uniref:hypothetical protein n=1 Tax=Thiohalospira halophila TaxID=381300 RepID=UPI00117F07C8|nr:hypothetical protein [Thiohalospira halophila]